MNKEYLIEKLLLSVSFIFIFLIGLMIIFLITESIPALNDFNMIDFIFGQIWSPDDNKFGILPMIMGSVYVTLIALVIAVPLSISCAIFLEEIASEKLKNIFKPIIQTLAGIPSVIYGFFGLTVIVPFIGRSFGGSGFSIIAASIILAIMILPTIISVSQDAIKSVPDYYRQASLGLGSTKWQCIKNIILPISMPGIATAVILGLGRAIGETLAVLMLVGNVSQIPNSILSPARTLTSNIALEMGYATNVHYNALFTTALVLFIVILILMLISAYIQRKYALKEAI